ncbi:MAG: molybdopterin molybdotransferase MoeA [Candidatus Kariarchaeaceae archaeon]
MSIRGSGFSETMAVSQALGLLFENVKIEEQTEKISTKSGLDRTLAEDIIATINLPGFKRSAMDGFAVQASDTHGATETNPIQLIKSGVVEIGDTKIPSLHPGEAIRISTGAPIPLGSDAVIQIEDCEELDNKIEIVSSVTIGRNVAKPDEDVKSGEQLFNRYHMIKPWDIGLIEAIGKGDIQVISRPKVSTLSTGDELVSSNSIPEFGQVVDSNRPAINSWIQKLGGEIIASERCDDNPEVIEEKLLELSNISDLIVTSGGTSVGSKDYLPDVIRELGDLWVHGVSIRPGKPLAIGKIINQSNKEIPIIALPGYPLATFINFELFVAPLLSHWTKFPIPWQGKTKVKLLQKIPSKSGYRDFIRLKKQGDGAVLMRITGAGILSSLVNADYMLEIPEHVEGYSEGDVVEVKVLRGE